MGLVCVCLLLAPVLAGQSAQAPGLPVIEHAGPPGWWANPAGPERVQLLLEGEHLEGAAVVVDRPGVRVERVEPLPSRQAVLAELVIHPTAEPGPVRLAVVAGGHRLEYAWEVYPPSTHRAAGFGPDDVLYLIMPDRFASGDPANDRIGMIDPMLDRASPHAYHGGDFRGIEERLPYLAELGVTTLWLTPVYALGPRWFVTKVDGKDEHFADYHGYAPVEFYEVEPRFGGEAAYRSLVAAAHRLGLKVVQDQIVGYTGMQHRWRQAPPSADWFHGPIDRPPFCNFQFEAAASPHALEADRRGLTEGWFFGILPDLRVEDERVQRYAIQQSLWWARRFEADGIRLDTYPMVDRGFWSRWSQARRALDPGLNAVGEAFVGEPPLLSFFIGGEPRWDGIDPGVETVFDFPLAFTLMDVVGNHAPARKLGEVLARDFLYRDPNQLVTFLDNHDTARLAGLPRVSPELYRVAAAFLLTMRGVPQLTWGAEIGLGGSDKDRRSIPGGWPGDERNAFAAAGRTPDEQATFQTFQALIALRKRESVLRQGKVTQVNATDTTYAYIRHQGAERILVLLNFGAEAASFELPQTELLAGVERAETLHGEGGVTLDAGKASALVPGERALVVRLRAE